MYIAHPNYTNNIPSRFKLFRNSVIFTVNNQYGCFVRMKTVQAFPVAAQNDLWMR